MMKTHGNERLSLRFKVRDRFPYVRMGVSLTAVRVSLSGVCCRSRGVGGMTLTSEPVSMRKLIHKLLSLTKNRRLWNDRPETPVATSIRPECFPKYMGPCTSGLHLRTLHDTNR